MDASAGPYDDLGHAMLDGIRQPMMAIDARRRISMRNESAQALLAEATLLREDGGQRLHASDPENDALLEQALRELGAGRRDRWSIRLSTAPGKSVGIQLRRLSFGNGTACAALTVLERPQVDAHARALADALALTPAEARVAALLAQGLAPKQVATLCHVSTSTVRTQVRKLFEKTGTHRQADLVRVLLLAGMF